MKHRLLDMALQSMDPQAFEDLVYALVRAEEPSAIQLRPPDAGRDTIVPADGGGGERVWQAKRHTSGIDWAKCEESLNTALEKREPEEITFVFPVNMSETNETGLKALRTEYPQVRILDPWTAGTLREKLAEHPLVRLEHIERPLGIDRGFERASVERLAGLKEQWDMQTTAAINGPLAVLGLNAALVAAEACVERGDLRDASARFSQMADQAGVSMPAVADVLLLRAARYAGEARERSRAAELHLRVSRSAAQRGEDTAEYAAFRASWELSEQDRWRSSAATARAVWHEHPDEAIPVLRDALDRSLAAADLAGVAEWGEAACDALAAQEDWIALRDVAERAAAALGPVQDGGARLAIELDHLDAKAASGTDVEHEIHQLLLTPVGRERENAARIRARVGVIYARSGNTTSAALSFGEAAQLWLAAGDAEDEIAEAIFSQDAVGQLVPGASPLDQTERIAAADLRGRALTAAVRADRKEAEGLRACLNGRAYEALRALMVAWSIHRRSGHFGGCARVGTSLRALYEGIEEWPDALGWAVRTGNHQAARDAAEHLAWDQVERRLRLDGPPWERGPSFEAIAVVGALASDREIAELTEPLLEAAGDHDGEQYLAMHPAPAARRALSTILCGINSGRFQQAFDEVVYETEHTPYPPSESTQGLLLATEAGICDATLLLAEVACDYSPAHVRSVAHVMELIEHSPDALKLVEQRAHIEYTALVLAARLKLPDSTEALAVRAADVTARLLSNDLMGEELVTHRDRGLLAQWASSSDQTAVARDLVDVLANPDDLDVHRYEAGGGLETLAPALDPLLASTTLDELLSVRDQVAMPSRTTGLRSHPNEHLARTIFRAPAAGPYVRAAALSAAYALADRAKRAPELSAALTQAREDPDSTLRASVVHIARAHPEPVEIDLRGMLDDEDVAVGAAAFAECVRRGSISSEHALFSSLADPSQPLSVRCTVLVAARRAPMIFRAALEQLARDPHVYVRAAARHALASHTVA